MSLFALSNKIVVRHYNIFSSCITIYIVFKNIYDKIIIAFKIFLLQNLTRTHAHITAITVYTARRSNAYHRLHVVTRGCATRDTSLSRKITTAIAFFALRSHPMR